MLRTLLTDHLRKIVAWVVAIFNHVDNSTAHLFEIFCRLVIDWVFPNRSCPGVDELRGTLIFSHGIEDRCEVFLACMDCRSWPIHRPAHVKLISCDIRLTKQIERLRPRACRVLWIKLKIGRLCESALFAEVSKHD